MSCLLGGLIILVCLILANSHPVVFIFLVGPVVIVWVVRWANKQSDRASRGDPPMDRGRTQAAGTPPSVATRSPAVNAPAPERPRMPPPHVQQADNRPTRTSLRWVGPGSSINVGRYQIADPLTYCSAGRAMPPEASCIDYSLPVGARVDEPKGALGYWPDYSRLSPNQRANYLHWMASGRTSPLTDIGYAFIFFYGLERRVLVDGADVRPIAAEVLRLLSRYSFSGSFNAYASNFLAFIAAKGGIDRLADSWFNAFAEPFFRIGGDPMSVALAWLHVHQRPLPPRLARVLASHDVRFPSSVVTQRLPEQFEQLFAKRYRESFGDGLVLKCAKRPLRLIYQTATPSFRSSQHLTPVDTPNVLGIPTQFNKLIDVWAACIEELKPLSRKLAKGVDVNTREAYNALPEALKSEIDHPDKPQWDRVVSSHVVKEGLALLQISDIAAIGGLAPQARLTSKQSVELADTANRVGYVLVPDCRVTGSAYRWSDVVGLLRPKAKPAQPVGDSYRPASRMLELGIAMAAADGNVTADEMEHISQFLETEFELSPDDLARLEAYREVLTVAPPSMKSVAAQLRSALSRDQLTMLCHFLVGVAAADGSVPKDEIRSLRSAYSALGVDETDLFTLLSEISASSESPVDVATAPPARPGEPIPPLASVSPAPDITIDHDRVRRLIDETREVSRMLGEAMQEIIPENEPVLSVSGPAVAVDLTEHPAATADTGQLSGVPYQALEQLDPRYHKLLGLLLARDEWKRGEFDALVKASGLMPSSTVEMINSWSDEHLGDFLIDESDSYSINTQILGE